MGNTLKTDTRGASEVLGFVLVFSLVTATVGYVYVGGISGLSDRRDAERVNNAERAFDVLASNVEDLGLRGAPSRATEIKLADARLGAGDPVAVNVTAEHSSGDSRLDVPQKNYTLDPIVYDGGTGAQFVYANGAVIRQQPGGSVLVRSPPLIVRAGRIVLPIVLTDVESGDVAGSTTVRIRTTHRETTLLHAAHDTGTYDLTVRLETSRTGPWKRFFETRGMSCNDPPPGALSCTATGLTEVYVTVVRVNVVFE